MISSQMVADKNEKISKTGKPTSRPILHTFISVWGWPLETQSLSIITALKHHHLSCRAKSGSDWKTNELEDITSLSWQDSGPHTHWQLHEEQVVRMTRCIMMMVDDKLTLNRMLAALSMNLTGSS
jgi:hypothetical protein